MYAPFSPSFLLAPAVDGEVFKKTQICVRNASKGWALSHGFRLRSGKRQREAESNHGSNFTVDRSTARLGGAKGIEQFYDTKAPISHFLLRQ